MMTAPDLRAGRLFLAVPITPDARKAIDDHLVRHLGPRPLPGRPVVPANWHLSLRFLGETQVAALVALRQRLDLAVWPTAFEVDFARLGAFPRADRARVLWLGMERGAEEVGRLAAIGELAAVGAGFAPERRPFNGHLTLSRLEPPADLRALLDAVPSIDVTMPVKEVVLLRSHLGRGPAVYEAVARWTLASS